MKDIKVIISTTHIRILEYRKANYETAHSVIKYDVNSVEIALSLAEIYIHNRNLSENEIEWFQGKRFITETFQNQWKDIADNYLIISDFVKTGKINRS